MNRKLIRPSLGNSKETYNGPASPSPSQSARKKPAPPEQTHAENFYYVKQMQSRTPMTVVLTDGAGNVTEGPGFNVFAVRGGRVSTPRT